MAYLPPAGKRDLTESKLSYLPTMSEINNPKFTKKMLEKAAKKKKPKIRIDDLPPLKSKSEDWIVPPMPRYPSLSYDSCPMHPQCLGIPYNYPKSDDVHAHCDEAQCDRRILPYGLPPDSFDVKIRTNWFDHWKEEHYKYAGAYQLWEAKYGKKYFYTDPRKCQRC